MCSKITRESSSSSYRSTIAMRRNAIKVGKQWESSVLFSLGVIASGKVLHTAGITSRDDDGAVVGPGDMRAQVSQCFKNLKDILDSVSAGWEDVIKYTIFTTDIESFNNETFDIRRHFFVDRPAATLIEVRRLIHPEMMVEIEATVSIP